MFTNKTAVLIGRSSIRRFVVAASFMGLSLAAQWAIAGPTTQPATQPTTRPIAITWEQAKDHVGDLATVTGPVVGTHDFGQATVLNVGKEFPDADRFTVFIPGDKRTGVPEDLYQGATISATGSIKLYHEVPEIEAGAADITVIKPASTEPATQP